MLEDIIVTQDSEEQLLPPVDDFNKTCRFCLSNDNLNPIFNLCYKGIDYLAIIKSCISIQVKKDDPLPKNMCDDCVVEMNKFYEFRRKCKNTELHLNKIAREKQLEEEDFTEVIVIVGETNEYSSPVTASILELQDFLGSREVSLNEEIIKEETVDLDESENDAVTETVESFDETNVTETTEEFINTNETIEAIKPEDSSEVINDQISETNVKLKKKRLDCVVCSKVFTDFAALLKHYSVTGHNKDVKLYKCECNKVFIHHGDYNKHKVTHLPKTYECNQCGLKFDDDASYKTHRKENKHCKTIGRTCSVCNKICKSKDNLTTHMRVHTNEKPFECQYCGRRFNMRANWKRHLCIHTGEKRHTCEVCGKGFIQLVSLKKHEKSHLVHKQETPACDYCNRTFPTMQGLKLHLSHHLFCSKKHSQSRQTPESERLFLCEECGKGFPAKYHLLKHCRTHSTDRNFICGECGKGFRTPEMLKRHKMAHEGHKLHQCNVCEKTFVSSGNMSIHMRIHTGDAPYECEVCRRRFKQPQQLARHRRTHTGEKPFQCSFCGKCFADNGILTVHRRIHTGELPYLCAQCGRAYRDINGLKKHKKVCELSLEQSGISSQEKCNSV